MVVLLVSDLDQQLFFSDWFQGGGPGMRRIIKTGKLGSGGLHELMTQASKFIKKYIIL